MSGLRAQIQRLEERIDLVRMDAINLPNRAVKLLKTEGISSAGSALYFVVDRLAEQHGIGAKTINESIKAASIFLEKLDAMKEQDLAQLSDPREKLLREANGNLLIAFPTIVELYHSKIVSAAQRRNLEVIQKRFGLDGSPEYTLDKIGTYYDVTRERIRQIEAKTIKQLGEILSGSLTTKNWTLPQIISDNYLRLCEKLGEFDLLVTKRQLDILLTKEYDATLESGYLNVLMETLGYAKLTESALGFRGVIEESWYEKSRYKKSDFEAIFKSLNVILDSPKKYPLFDISVSIKKMAKLKVSNAEISAAIAAASDFEKADDVIFVRIECLRSAADKAFRILDTHGKPLHFSNIAREINLLSKGQPDFIPMCERNLTNQMVSDPRFVPIGRSGEWGLSDWDDYKNITIVKALEQILHKSGKPLKLNELCFDIKVMRPDASDKSIMVYLNDEKLFTRVTKGVFGLKKWRLPAAIKIKKKEIVRNDEFAAAVKSCLISENPTPIQNAISIISKRTKLSEATIRQRLARLEVIQIRKVPGRRHSEVFCENIDALDLVTGNNRILLRDQIQDEIRAILYERPNKQLRKGELYKLVTKNVKCLKPTFYQYIEKMDDIETEQKGNSIFVMYRHKEVGSRLDLNVHQYKPSPDLMKKLSRALSKLTLDEVDMALFEFGVLFENAIRDYLVALRKKEPAKVSGNDLSKLAAMIDCAVREKIVTKGHHLNVLREERNNRAHGNIPSKEEREVLYNKAHYIADLFLNYICFFDNEVGKV